MILLADCRVELAVSCPATRACWDALRPVAIAATAALQPVVSVALGSAVGSQIDLRCNMLWDILAVVSLQLAAPPPPGAL